MPTGETSQAPAGVDPAGVRGPAEFAAALTELRSRAGRTIREVSRETGVPSATLGGYFSGRHMPSTTHADAFSGLLVALGVPEDLHGAWWETLRRVRRQPGPRAARTLPYRGLESYGVDDADWYVGREEAAEELGGLVSAMVDASSPGAPAFVSVVGASGAGKSSLVRAGLVARLQGDRVAAAVMAPGGDPLAELDAALRRCGVPGQGRLLVVDQLEEIFAEQVSEGDRRAFLDAVTELAYAPATAVVVAMRADFYGHALADPALYPLLRCHQLPVGPLGEVALRRVVTEPAARAGCSVEAELVERLLHDLAPRGVVAETSVLPLMSHALLQTWEEARGGPLTLAHYEAVGGVAGAVQRTAETVYNGLSSEGRREARRIFSQLVTLDDEGLAMRRRVAHADLTEESDAFPEVVDAFVAGRILTATEDTLEISHEALLTAWPRLTGWVEEDRDALAVRRRVGQAAQAWTQHGREDAGLMRGTLLDLAQALEQRGRPALSVTERVFLSRSSAHAEAEVERERRRARRMRTMVAATAVLALGVSVLSGYLLRALDSAEVERQAAVSARNEALSRQVAIEATRLAANDPALAVQLALSAYGQSPTVEARSSLLDLVADRAVTRLGGPEGSMEAVVSDDGALVATVGSDGSVRLWRRSDPDVAPVRAGAVQAAEGGELFAVAFAPGRPLLAVGGMAGVVTLVDVSEPDSPRIWGEPQTGPTAAVQDLAFAPDGDTLYAATSDPALHRWQVGATEVRALPVTRGFDGSVQGVDVGAGGRVVTGSVDGAVRLWSDQGTRLRFDRVLAQLDGASVRGVALSPSGDVVAAGATDKAVRVWDVRSGRLVTPPLRGFSSWVNSVRFSADGSALAAAASGGLLRVWETEHWQVTTSLPAAANNISVHFLPGDREVITGSLDGFARLVPMAGPRLPQLKDNLWGLTFIDGGDRMLLGVGSAAPAVRMVDTRDRRRPVLLDSVLQGPASAGALDGVIGATPDGSTVVAGTSTGWIVVWREGDAGRLRRVGALPVATALIENISFTADGAAFAVASDDGSVTILETGSRGLPRRLAATPAAGLALGVALSADGGLLAVGGADDLVHLWRRDGTRLVKLGELDGFANYVYGLSFSSDGHWLAGGSADGTVRVWDVSDPDRVRPAGPVLRGPADTVFAVAFAPAGDRLAGASQDGTVWVWQWDPAGSPKRPASLEARLHALGGPAYQVAFSPDGTTLAAAGSGGRARLWTLSVREATRLVCDLAGTAVSRTEWLQYVPGAAYQEPCGAA